MQTHSKHRKNRGLLTTQPIKSRGNFSLTLSGERSQPTRKDSEEAQGRRVERGHGQFYRRFVLPDTVDSEKVNATGNHGVLTVTIPKQAKAMPRRIQIGS
jgi:HSP20 family protein